MHNFGMMEELQKLVVVEPPRPEMVVVFNAYPARLDEETRAGTSLSKSSVSGTQTAFSDNSGFAEGGKSLKTVHAKRD